MKVNIHPYQWELLACMMTYKVTNGLCLDYKRLRGVDYEKIHLSKPSLKLPSLKQLFNGRQPAGDSLDDLCGYLANVFSYHNWAEFSEKEENAEMFFSCPDWRTYERLRDSRENSRDFRKLQNIRNWTYSRVISLAKRSWDHSGFHFLHNQGMKIKEYAGHYKFFMPGQIPPVNFKDVYVDPLTINDEGEIIFRNDYIKNRFYGYATIQDPNTLQVFAFSQSAEKKTGCEYV